MRADITRRNQRRELRPRDQASKVASNASVALGYRECAWLHVGFELVSPTSED